MTGRAAPNMFKRAPVRIFREDLNRVIVEFEGKRFVKGSASGDGFNCLIYALLGALNDVGVLCVADVPWVRDELRRRFKTGSDQVTAEKCLDLRPHYASVIDLIGLSARANGCDAAGKIRAENFSVTCVAEDQLVVGEVVGSGASLYVLNEGLQHFVPLLRDRSRWTK